MVAQRLTLLLKIPAFDSKTEEAKTSIYEELLLGKKEEHSDLFFFGGGGGGWRRGMLDGLAEVRRLHRSSGIHGAFLLTDPNGDASLNKISNNLVVMLMLVPCVANEDVH